ncbi:MAG: DUF47 domain-containing protein [Dictyoglomus sp.]|nr:DUF47 domain-containing protein [Dictyoglomus sp.]MCX7941979.1 DUF47 domain-containing protein [Dictyoglomaceae bacterium]MDW8187706.1 DUF47 domain-containing protein [Dictyoglomus sp.]
MKEDKWKKIWEDLKPQIGSFAKKAGETIVDLAKTLGKESWKLARIGALKAEILSLESSIREVYKNIGERAYNLYKEGKDISKESFLELFGKIDKLNKDIEYKKEEIKRIAEEEKLEPEDVEKIPPSEDGEKA